MCNFNIQTAIKLLKTIFGGRTDITCEWSEPLSIQNVMLECPITTYLFRQNAIIVADLAGNINDILHSSTATTILNLNVSVL